MYGAGEVPVEAGRDGVVAISRDEDDVFSPTAMASFEGKPVTNDHPPLGMKVNPTNWRHLAIGDVNNVRRGDGAILDSNFLYADLIIKDADAIRDILDGKKEVSAGYDAEYEQLEPGRGRQHDIIGNHVALVDKGRCGPRCAIGDTHIMPKVRGSYRDRLMAAFKTRDETAMLEELDKVKDMLGDVVSDEAMDLIPNDDSKSHHITVNVNGMGASKAPPAPAAGQVVGDDVVDPMQQGAQGMGAAPGAGGEQQEQMPPWAAQMMERLGNLEQGMMLLAQEDDDAPDDVDPEASVDPDPEPDADDVPGKVDEPESDDKEDKMTGDRRRAAVGDSSSLAVPFQDMLSRAAILYPTIRLPTFDAAKGARITVDSMCDFRRLTLAKAWSTADGQDVIKRLYHAKKPDFTRDTMTCDAITVLFNGASELRREANTQDERRSIVVDHGRELSQPNRKNISPAEINKMNKAKYGITA